MLSEVHADGRTVFLSSHNLPEVEHTCGRVGIIREGKLVSVDEVASLKQHEVDISFAGPALPTWFSSLPDVRSVTLESSTHEVHLVAQGELQNVIKVAADHNARR